MFVGGVIAAVLDNTIPGECYALFSYNNYNCQVIILTRNPCKGKGGEFKKSVSGVRVPINLQYHIMHYNNECMILNVIMTCFES